MSVLTAGRALRTSVSGPRWVLALGTGVVVGYLWFLTRAMNSWPYTSWLLLVLIPALFAVGVVIIRAVTASDETPMFATFVFALALKLAASFVRFFVAFELYGSGDSLKYHYDATIRMNDFFDHKITLWNMVTPSFGTGSITDLTSAIYAMIGPSRLGGFAIFSWLGFWGLFLFCRAIRIGLPECDYRRYVLLVMFLPSLWFWPSSIGKEAVMIFALGICAYGAAKITRRTPGGWPVLTLGLLTGGVVRPHVSAVVLAGLTVAVMFRANRDSGRGFGLGGRFIGVLVLMIGLAFAFGKTVDYLVPPNTYIFSKEGQVIEAGTGLGALDTAFQKATAGTAGGGSEIDRPLPNSPLEYPGAAFTVLFRPTLLEARNAQNVAAGAETTLLLAIVILSWKRFKRLPSFAFRRPYVLMCIVYTGIFCFAWSAFANLGALARQRVQVWPFMLVLLCLPKYQPKQTIVTHKPRSTDRQTEEAVVV